ncbi:MAG: regulatory protein RecX [Nitrospinota bacterium]
MNAAVRLLAYRDRSVNEIRGRLKQKEFQPAVINRVVEELISYGYLNDEKFAKIYSESLARNKKVGPRYILNALAKKGIKRDIAQHAVSELFDDPAEEESKIKTLVEQKISGYKKSLTPLQKKKRIYNFLIRRGFSYYAVMQVIGRREFGQ